MESRTNQASVRPYEGVVTIRFSDAIIASTDRAMLLDEPGREAVFYVPFEDIYFDFLQRSETSPRNSSKGAASWWNASAVGEAAHDVMWTYEDPAPGFEALLGHGGFDAGKVMIEAVPTRA